MLSLGLKNPFRLFVLLILVAGVGIWSGMELPVSLYPQTSKPVVRMSVIYAGLSSEEFIRKYGATIEYQLENIKNTGLKLESVKANYGHTNVDYTVTYDWHIPFAQALKEVQTVAAGAKGFLPRESADSISVWQWNENAGFLALSFYGKRQTLNELYNLLDPILSPGLKNIPDAEEALLWNPESQEVSISLYPEKMVVYGLLPGEIYRSLDAALPSLTGGELRIGQKGAHLQIPTALVSKETLENHVVALQDGKRITLKDIAEVTIGRSEKQSRAFKTDGKESLILFANPKSGANVKRMAEDVLAHVKKNEKLLPEGVEYKVLVDPSEFIRNSIQNLMKDVILAAFLAVLVLFLFIGNFKNVATAALEIPLSMIVAFIVMKATDMNLNLISLGGLALAAGMNVDASVVVMENIFRRQAEWLKNNSGEMNWQERFDIILSAVREVAAPIFLSIATTLIVFIPLAMTTDLTNAILGDLARAVIYSHAVSGFVAIFVVPTIRLVLMKDARMKPAPLAPVMRVLENKYLLLMEKGLDFPKLKWVAISLPIILAGLLLWTIVPRLPKEIVGTPDTDWIFMAVTAPQSSAPRQMENILQEVESKAMKVVGTKVAYTFMQMHNKTNGNVMLRLKDKSDMKSTVKTLQELLQNTPDQFFYVDAWNPAELPLPQMNHLELRLTGSKHEDIRQSVSRLKYFLNEQGDYKRINTTPSEPRSKILRFIPHEHLWSQLQLPMMDILDLTVYTQNGKSPGSMMVDGKMTPLTIAFADERYKDPELLGAYPLKMNSKVIPLSALGEFELADVASNIYRQDGREQALITSTLDKNDEDKWEALSVRYEKLVKDNTAQITAGKDVTIEAVRPKKELFAALAQLKNSLLISLILIALVLWLQFQSLRYVSIIMLTIPLGFIGALISLFAFQSTLSLNSALGIILLNGIAVNNAILLVEVYTQLLEKGLSSRDALRETCRSRLRPILITSLTTMLGMLPIAMGWGDGGKILQPLGIVVAFGLFFSTLMALFIVPWVLYSPKASKLTTHDNTDLKSTAIKNLSSSEEISLQ